MNNLFKVGVVVLIVLMGVISFIDAKPSVNPANSIFSAQTASNNNVQKVSGFSGFQKMMPSTPSSGNNVMSATTTGFSNLRHFAGGDFNPGGFIFLDIAGDPGMANLPYVIAFSTNGDFPGAHIPGVGNIPLNPPYLASFFGFLDNNGNGQFVINLPNNPSFIGLPLTSAVGVIDPSNQVILSNPVSYRIGSGVFGVACCVEGVLNGPESNCVDGGVSINYCRLNAGGAVQQCIPHDTIQEPPSSNASNLTPGNVSASSSYIANLTNAIAMSNITGRTYTNTTYDCDDFADDLEQYLQGLGYNATYTQFVKYVGNSSTIDYAHAIIDVHLPNGEIVWIEPQTGRIVNLDFDGDGTVEANVNQAYVYGHHPTDDNAKIYVYDSAAAAAAAGAPRD
jgi:hypothetical protein